MCFITYKEDVVQIAKQEIEVVKFLAESIVHPGVYKSPSFGFLYLLNLGYKTTILPSTEKTVPLMGAIEYWAAELGIEGSIEDQIRQIKDSPKLQWIGSGFHSYMKGCPSIYSYRVGGLLTEFKAIIPKGSEYYKCPFGTVVSNKIKIV